MGMTQRPVIYRQQILLHRMYKTVCTLPVMEEMQILCTRYATCMRSTGFAGNEDTTRQINSRNRSRKTNDAHPGAYLAGFYYRRNHNAVHNQSL